MKKMLVIPAVWALLAIVLLSGCSSAKFIRTGTAMAPKAEGCDIEVFNSKLPDRDYEELGIIEGEGIFGSDTLEKVLPKMKIEACRAGGDAIIIKSSEKHFDSLDDRLHVNATVIRWTD